jgi:hypothetical protein
MRSAYDDGASLAGMISSTIDEYASGREVFWEQIDPSGAKSLEFVDAMATQVLEASDKLLAPGDTARPLGWSSILALLDDQQFGRITLEKIEILLAERFAADTDCMVARCKEIAGELAHARPNRSVMNFMHRLSRCYIAGFLPESVMLCRAVIENAVNEVIDAKHVNVLRDEDGKRSMRAKRDALCRAGFLSKQGSSQAGMIWLRGSAAIHNDPNGTQAVFESVQLTLSVLSELYDDRP